MERVDKTVFFNNLDAEQLVQFRNQEFLLFKTVVLPAIISEKRRCYYTHFLTLEGTPKIYMSAEVVYQNHGVCISRNLGAIRTYKTEIDMDFHMSILEFDNTLEPNPVLFNGLGTRDDATAKFVNMFVVAYHIIEEPNLN